jgi:dolichyl-diphosphooligosaccharide--protein glycosyltransferase
VIGRKDVTLEYMEEAYTTENWLVRIYKVKHDVNRPSVKYQAHQIKTKKSPNLSKKGKSKKGILKVKPAIVKGKKPSQS